MVDRIDQDVLDAILAGATSIRRRIEIHESDGVTLWLPIEDSSRIISGSVNVDYSRPERRSFDLVLDNADGLLDHDPEGLWYDKIIKIYRGINFRNNRLTPKIVVIAENEDFPVIPFLKRLGYTDIADRTQLAGTTLENLYGYDLVVANYGDADPAEIETLLLGQAQYAGINVLTFSSRATDSHIPLIDGSAPAVVPWLFEPISTIDTPFSHSFGAYSYVLDGTAPQTIVTAVAPAARAAAVDPVATVNYPAISLEDASGVKWFHYQAVIPAAVPTQMIRLITAALEWLYTYADERTFEVQIGEFMIDNIESPHFPRQVTLNGRDYAKKLVDSGSKFRNTVTFATGTSLDSLTTGIAGGAGITKYLLSTNGAALTADVTFERNTPRWDAIAKIHNDAGFEVFFNSKGYLATRAFLDPTLSPTSVTLKTGGTDGNLAKFNKQSTDSEVRNVVVVTGANQDDLAGGNIWYGVAENNEPSSPTRIEKLGPREYFHETAFVKSNEDCVALAKRLLSVKALESFDLGFEALVFPWLEVGEVATFQDPDPSKGEPSRYLLTSLTIPMGLGPMSGAGKRITIVGPVGTLEDTLGLQTVEEDDA